MLHRYSRFLSLIPSLHGLALTVEHRKDISNSELLLSHRSELMLRLTRLRPQLLPTILGSG